jgi:hypothetical protein
MLICSAVQLALNTSKNGDARKVSLLKKPDNYSSRASLAKTT